MDKLSLFLDYAMLGAGGGERLIPFRYIVNTMKGLTPIFILSLMWYYQNFSIGAFLYVRNLILFSYLFMVVTG